MKKIYNHLRSSMNEKKQLFFPVKKVLIFCVCLLALTACTQFSAEYKRTKLENDSLKLQILKSETELNSILSILQTVEEDIQSIRISEEILTVQHDSELSESRRENLRNNMNLINETLQKNRLKLTELQNRLNDSSLNFSSLQKTIERLTRDMNEKSALVSSLQNELDNKEAHIEELAAQIEDLHADVQELAVANQLQVDRIQIQDDKLNTVYYCFGTRKELKEQNILTGGGLFSKSKALQADFNRDYFVSVDKRMLSSIPLYSSKAAIKTNHPDGSFHLNKDKDGYLILEITDPPTFWSLSPFLVIEVR